MSFLTLVSNFKKTGFKQWFRDLNYIGTTKYGNLQGVDQFGNKFWENLDEVPGRTRWVEYVEHDFNATQVPPEWRAWLSHIRGPPPPQDEQLQMSKQKWQSGWFENVTGTRGAFKTYSTTAPKVTAWQGQPAERTGS